MPMPFTAEPRRPRSFTPSSYGPLLPLPQGLALVAVFFLLATGAIDQLTTPAAQQVAPARLLPLAPAHITGQQLRCQVGLAG
ncbi:hypothetical protein [Pseudomonas sp. H9]|uniref:hypothetical protein n=1 Tax=Pseudomonas sp. H9 TaxID=483968 RepID=UPI00105765AD|nr:hypothetical protein [Pseudomonas sp. H9]TDF83789.1 hypothetical protein E1573_08510 [Pseudomonas sp. H9]